MFCSYRLGWLGFFSILVFGFGVVFFGGCFFFFVCLFVNFLLPIGRREGRICKKALSQYVQSWLNLGIV